MRQWTIPCAALLVAGMTHASALHVGELHKCIGKGGAVAIQDHPCDATKTTAWVKPADRDTRTPEQWQALRERQQREQEGSRYLSRLAGTD